MSNLKCAVRGAIRPGAICGSVIVGMELCGFKGQCEHQRASSVMRECANAECGWKGGLSGITCGTGAHDVS